MITALFWAAVGYVFCVVFPMPIVSAYILSKWQALGVDVKLWFASFSNKPVVVANTTVSTTTVVTKSN